MLPVIDVTPIGRYSRKDAAKALGVAAKSLDLWTRQGRIKKFYTPKGTRPYFRGSDLIKLWKGEI